MLKRVLFALSPLAVLLCLSAAARGQDSSTPRAPISGGVLNGKAVSKPAPPYPAVAKAARARGVVVIQVTVDEGGKVISASAVSGHPLLRQAAVQAAQQARFSPTLLSGQPVKVTGTITYNFVLAAGALYDDNGRLQSLFNLTDAPQTCALVDLAGSIVAVERDASGEKIVGLTIEGEGGKRTEVALGPKLYNDLPPEHLEKAAGLLREGRRVRLSLRDCRESGQGLSVEDIEAAD
jgi:TonB family protein